MNNYLSEFFHDKTPRRRRRMICEQKEKTALRLNRLRKSLYTQYAARPTIPLRPPVQKGYKRFFVLKDEIASGRKVEFFTALLAKINTCQYSDRRDFKVKRKKFRKRIYVVKPQKLQPVYKILKIKLTESEIAYFEERFDNNGNSFLGFKDPQIYFRLIVKPNYVGFKRDVAAELCSKIDQLENYITKNELYVKRYRYRYKFESNKKIEKYNRSLIQLLNDEWYSKI
ncbi:hypothetical protein DVR12_08735 [Chitinophaga silvatica]|uniref:Uncharacterized protein n=1 Tax=Chitinophaga silvatica TaxID=2282649 RepID=A0A3E1YCH7_9BACT|nr:hypothetical protein [Chitinophaga silvatica]RFS23959.1 hypothetical protein DVR12_08735 [Chitinophaga silvatica]